MSMGASIPPMVPLPLPQFIVNPLPAYLKPEKKVTTAYKVNKDVYKRLVRRIQKVPIKDIVDSTCDQWFYVQHSEHEKHTYELVVKNKSAVIQEILDHKVDFGIFGMMI